MQSDSIAFQLVANALQAADMRQRVYANNIANMETPGYKREDVQFESLLQAALSGTAASTPVGANRWIPIDGSGASSDALAASLNVQPVVVQSGGGIVDNNGNNVDVDAEMSDLAENQIKYEALVQDLQDRFSRLKTAINGG